MSCFFFFPELFSLMLLNVGEVFFFLSFFFSGRIQKIPWNNLSHLERKKEEEKSRIRTLVRDARDDDDNDDVGRLWSKRRWVAFGSVSCLKRSSVVFVQGYFAGNRFRVLSKIAKIVAKSPVPPFDFFCLVPFRLFRFFFFCRFYFLSLSLSLSHYPLFVGGVGRGRFGPPKLLNVAELFSRTNKKVTSLQMVELV